MVIYRWEEERVDAGATWKHHERIAGENANQEAKKYELGEIRLR